jgi:Tfp pilus assembly protein PilN
MRIEINLLPGAKRGKRKSSGPALDFKALGAAIAARFKDVWLTAAIGSAIVAASIIGVMFMAQRTKEAGINSALEVAVKDSANYAVVLQDRARAEARRDSALVQLNIIKAIDEDRYIWPHILDEVSRALPQYTWLKTLAVTGTLQGTNPAAAYRPPPPDTTRGKKRKLVFELPRDTVRLHLVGQTADLQAFTRFYRTLEDSPFLGSVTFSKTETVLIGNKSVTQFDLDMVFTRPDTTLLRRVPFTITSGAR